jgi:lipoprotein-releasing system permease protein
LEQQFDDLVFLPIEIVERLTDYQGKRTAIEVYLSDEKVTNKVKSELKDIMGGAFTVKDRDEQNEALFKAIKIEKLFIFISLLLIIGIASFNIFFSLTMLVIDKQDDIQTLSALGARRNLVQRIFFTEGAMIAFIGASIGLVLGAVICWLQMQFGFVTMGMESAIVDAYPVEMKLSDFVYASLGIIIITVIAAFFPARRAVAYMK